MCKRRWWVAAIGCAAALLLVTGPAAPAQQTGEAQELTSQGHRLMQENNFSEALKTLDEAVAADDKYAPAWFWRGYALGNLGRDADARDSFMRAAELSPGWADAHRMAAVAAGQAGDMETAWTQGIRAHQAGVDMTEWLRQLAQFATPPDNLDQQLSAPRIFVAEMDLEGVKARNENPFSRAVDTGDGATSAATNTTGDIANPRSTTTSRATGVGGQLISETQGERFNVLTKMRDALADSSRFGLVPRQDMSTYTLVIEVDDMGEDRTRRPLEGYIKLYDTRTGEEVYSRVLQMRNIASVADINADVEQYVRYLEEWLEKRVG